MTEQPLPPGAMASIVLSNFPDLVRKVAISDEAFVQRVGIRTQTSVTFPSATSFDRTKLHAALVAKANDVASDVSLLDEEGKIWDISIVQQDSGGIAHLSRDAQCLVVADVDVLLNDRLARAVSFQRIADFSRLHGPVRRRWESYINQSIPDEKEFGNLVRDLNLTPERTALRIANSLQHDSISLNDLMPIETAYYEHLVGLAPSDIGFIEYVESVSAAHIKGLVSEAPIQGGLSLALLMSSHSLLVQKISLSDLDIRDVVSTYEWVAENGSALALVGAIEAAIPILKQAPELVPIVERLAEQLRDGGEDRFLLSSALANMVSGFAARKQIFKGRPAFWRQLACFTHAALLEQLIQASDVDVETFVPWAAQSEARWFSLHTLVELSNAPRWLPDFASASQLRAEYFGRLAMTASAFEHCIDSPGLRAWLLGKDEGSIQATVCA